MILRAVRRVPPEAEETEWMPKTSAGLLMFRVRQDELEVLLVHPGGPYWIRKDEGAWTVPKGEMERDEDLLCAARREFEEETGVRPEGPYWPLSPVRQKSGKVVHGWAFEGNCDPERIQSNTFQLVWPPNSGQVREFPEVDRAEFLSLDEARRKIVPSQLPFLEELEDRWREIGA